MLNIFCSWPYVHKHYIRVSVAKCIFYPRKRSVTAISCIVIAGQSMYQMELIKGKRYRCKWKPQELSSWRSHDTGLSCLLASSTNHPLALQSYPNILTRETLWQHKAVWTFYGGWSAITLTGSSVEKKLYIAQHYLFISE